MCSGCGRVWRGLAEAHCAGCHEHFGSVSAFDRHQDERGCHDPNSANAKGSKRCEWHADRRLWVTRLDHGSRFKHPEWCQRPDGHDPGGCRGVPMAAGGPR